MAALVRSAVSTCLLAALPATAGAEIVYLASGRTLSVRAHRIEGDEIVLILRGGGEVACARALVRDILADEVPYPDPEEGSAALRTGVWSASRRDADVAELVEHLAAAYGVDARLVHAVVAAESGYQPAAVSRKGAMGLMQLMPATARQYAVADPFDPRANLEAGIQHLKKLLDRFELPLALAAYNAGEQAVERFGGIPPYRETRAYVAQVLSRLRDR